jgi:hypothetical protein
MLRGLTAVALSLALTCTCWGASSPATDARWDSYFAVWANDATAMPQTVEKFYASRVSYYGREMTLAEVYQDKLHLIRLWPVRAYHVAPGSVSTSCSEDNSRCQTTLVLDWLSANPALGVGAQGATTVSLVSTKQGGQIKIKRESGVPLLRSSCKLVGGNWSQKSDWRCSPYQFSSNWP